MPLTDETEKPERAGRVATIGFAVLALAVVAYFVVGMPGMDHSGTSDTMAGMEHAAEGEPMALAPKAFAARLAADDVVLVNVHVQARDGIAGTDATIAYDDIADDDRLPADENASIMLYCQTGRMSAQAGRDLIAAGYTDVSYLEGGVEAWERAGFDAERS